MSSPSLCSYPRSAALHRPTGGKLLALGVLPFRPAPAKARPTFYRTAPLLIGGKLLALGVLPFRPAPAKARPTFYRTAPPLIDIKFCNFRRDVL